jgi:hypothetical protein
VTIELREAKNTAQKTTAAVGTITCRRLRRTNAAAGA